MPFSHIKEFADNHMVMIVCLFLSVSTLSLYNQTQGYDFVNYDDNFYVYQNQELQKRVTLIDVVAWTFTSYQGGSWQPLTWLSYVIDYHLYGLNPGRYHLTNLIFHIINGLLLFILFKNMTHAFWQSAFIAALFALHPLHVESVAWISERKDVLSAFFSILTIFCYVFYVKRPNVLRLTAVVLFFCFALMSKPMAVTLPFVLLLLDFWPLERFYPDQREQINHSASKAKAFTLILEKMPLFAIMVIFCVVSLYAQKHIGAVVSLVKYPLHIRIGNSIISYAGYIIKMFLPLNLALFYPYPESLQWWKVVISFFLIAAISLFTIIKKKQMPYLFVGWLWFIGTLVPVIGIVQIGGQAMADRYTYIPLIGLFIMLAWGFPELFRNLKCNKLFFIFFAGMILSVLMTLTWHQVKYWKNSMTIFSHTLNVTTNNYIAHNNLGIEFIRQGNNKEAIYHFKQVLMIDPAFGEANYNMGLALSLEGKFQEAIPYYQEAVKSKPACEVCRTNLAIALEHQQQLSESNANPQQGKPSKLDKK